MASAFAGKPGTGKRQSEKIAGSGAQKGCSTFADRFCRRSTALNDEGLAVAAKPVGWWIENRSPRAA
jgi:hypothetical protein